MKPDSKMKPLKADNGLGRIEHCRVMLLIHGFLTQSESNKVKARVIKWCAKHGIEYKRF